MGFPGRWVEEARQGANTMPGFDIFKIALN